MATSTTYNKQQILDMIDKKSPNISFVKPKYAKSIKWDGYSQVYINGVAQSFITCSKCHCVLAWKPNDGTNVMDKHSKACKEESKSLPTQQSIESFFSPNDKNKRRLINSTKRKLTNTLAECCA